MPDLPLHGTVVVELCQNVAGPYAGLVLGQLGARVIKVERPGRGDDTRGWGPPFWDGESVMFLSMNAGKESVALDLRDEDDRARMWRLLEDADVVLASWRPGSLEKLGFGYEDVVARNDQVVDCSISGFGPRGPLRDAPGYDPLIQAFSGIMSVTGEPGRPPVRVGTSIIDMGTGLWAALAVLSALQRRSRDGRGAHVTASLFETGLAWLPYQLAGFLATGERPVKMGSGLPMLVPYQAFDTADRPIVVAAGNDAAWRRLCAAIDRGDLADDPDLATNPQRVAARERIVGALAETLATQPAAVWIERLGEVGVPCAPVQDVAEVVAHEQTRALDMLVDVPDAHIDDLCLPGLPFELDGHRPGPTVGAPRLDDDVAAPSTSAPTPTVGGDV